VPVDNTHGMKGHSKQSSVKQYRLYALSNTCHQHKGRGGGAAPPMESKQSRMLEIVFIFPLTPSPPPL